MKHNPFETVDARRRGRAGRESRVERGRATRPELKLGVCGEHGGDPESIDFFYRAGLDYVSCSPFRVPIARLSAAQAVLAGGGGRWPVPTAKATTETSTAARPPTRTPAVTKPGGKQDDGRAVVGQGHDQTGGLALSVVGIGARRVARARYRP